MRCGMGILTACGLAALSVWIGTAVAGETEGNPFATDKSASRRTIQYFSRSGKTSTQTAAPMPMPESAHRSAPTRYRRRVESLGGRAPRGIGAALGNGTRTRSSRVKHAEYRRPQWQMKHHHIKQVGETGANPFPGLGPDFNPFKESRRKPPIPKTITDPRRSKTGPFGTLVTPASAHRHSHRAASGPLSGRHAGLKNASNGPQTPLVSIVWEKLGNINVGQKCQFDLIVKNSGKSPARDVEVEASFPDSVRLTAARPMPAEQNRHLIWKFPLLTAGQQQRIHISLIPSRRGPLPVKAVVRITGSAEGLFSVKEPLLKIEVTGPKKVLIGEPASQTIIVSNPGSGTATNVSVEALLPPGLEHPRGKRLITQIGALSPGESRKVRLALSAIKGGSQTVHVNATADAGLTSRMQTGVTVVAPVLTAKIDGPKLRYVGRTARYRLTITNDAAAESDNVRVSHQIPDGFRFRHADHGAKYDAAHKSVHWFVGHLDPGQSVGLNVELVATRLGRFDHRVTATSEHGSPARGELQTRIEGTAALELKIVERDDPVEVGTTTTYEVRVHNAGSKAARNVGVSCELTSGVKLAGATGPADYVAENGMIIFKSLKTIAPGKSVTYRIDVRGTTAGNHRFRVRLASDSIKQPLITEELTNFYGE